MPEAESHPQNPKIVCVLGMHRSGTSLLTGTLRLLGVYLGADENLLPGDEQANKKGFWENRLIVDLNDALLSRLGGDWHNLPEFPPDWPASPDLGDLRSQVRALITEEFGDALVWGWKDPRACVTLPFWRRLMPPMSYILCLRNPVDVAGSLARVHGLPAWKSARLWVEHVRSALEHTSQSPRLVLFYEDFIDDWRASLERISAFLGLTPDQDALREVEEFVEAGLEHHRATVLEAIEDVEVSYAARSLYMALRLYDYYERKETLATSEIDRIFAEVLNAFGHHSAKGQADLDEVKYGFPSKMEEKNRELGLLNADLATKDETLRSLNAQLADSALSIKRLSLALLEKDATIANLEERYAAQERAIREVQSALRDIEESRRQKDMLLREMQAQVNESETRLNRITNSLGWRLLSYYGRLKHRYIIPLFKFIAPGATRPQVTKLDRKP